MSSNTPAAAGPPSVTKKKVTKLEIVETEVQHTELSKTPQKNCNNEKNESISSGTPAAAGSPTKIKVEIIVAMKDYPNIWKKSFEEVKTENNKTEDDPSWEKISKKVKKKYSSESINQDTCKNMWNKAVNTYIRNRKKETLNSMNKEVKEKLKYFTDYHYYERSFTEQSAKWDQKELKQIVEVLTFAYKYATKEKQTNIRNTTIQTLLDTHPKLCDTIIHYGKKYAEATRKTQGIDWKKLKVPEESCYDIPAANVCQAVWDYHLARDVTKV